MPQAASGAPQGGAEAGWWRAGWLVAVLLGGGLALLAPGGLAPPYAAAVALAALPAAAGLLRPRFGLSRAGADALEMALWGLCAAGACALTGGVAGPFAAFCIAPLAAASATGRAQATAAGAAASAAALGLAALAGVLAPVPAPPSPAAVGFGLVSLTAVAGGLAAGLTAFLRLSAHDLRRASHVETRLRDLLSDQPHLLVQLSPAGRVTAAWGRPPAGLPEAALAGRSLLEAAAADHQSAVEAAVAQAERGVPTEIGFTPAADPAAWICLNLARFERMGLVGVLRDGRAARDREAALEAARAEAEAQNAGKSRFLANMSHELRTPLNAIMGFSDIMRGRLFGPLPDRYAEYAELIHESGGHLLDLINDVLDMSKIEAERFELALEPFDAREAVSAVLRLMRGQADRAGVQLRGVLPREPLEVEADRRALKQIVLNLVSNALKFTPRQGAVTVTLQASGEHLELVVADTGVGMAPEDLERVGRPFEQAGDAEKRAAGTGLGLSLVRAFSELHGGEVEMESRLGEGTTVQVRLPVLAEPQAAPAEVANEA